MSDLIVVLVDCHGLAFEDGTILVPDEHMVAR